MHASVACMGSVFVSLAPRVCKETHKLMSAPLPARQHASHAPAWLYPDPQINSTKKKTGVISPKKFVQRLKRDNELFSGYMHQVSVGSQTSQCGPTCCTVEMHPH